MLVVSSEADRARRFGEDRPAGRSVTVRSSESTSEMKRVGWLLGGLLLAGCQLELGDAPCPCAAGFKCCTSINRCAPADQTCPSGKDMSQGVDTGRLDAGRIADRGPDAVSDARLELGLDATIDLRRDRGADAAAGDAQSPCGGDYDGCGDGSASAPFLIFTAPQLDDLGRRGCTEGTESACNAHVALMADVDLSTLPGDFAPIGFCRRSSTTGCSYTQPGDAAFGGEFDGNGHTIANLELTQHGDRGVGLFRQVAAGASIHHLRLSNVSVVGQTYVGALAGFSRGALTRVQIAGSVTGDSYVGGAVGYAPDGTIDEVSFSGVLTGDNHCGGILGFSLIDTKLHNCYVAAEIGGSFNTGGLVGYLMGLLQNSYATGTVVGAQNVGGLVGVISQGIGAWGAVEDSFCTAAVTGNDTGGSVGPVIGRIVDGRHTGLFFDARDFDPSGATGRIVNSNGSGLFDPPGVTGIDTATTGQSDYFFQLSNAPMTSWNAAGTTWCAGAQALPTPCWEGSTP